MKYLSLFSGIGGFELGIGSNVVAEVVKRLLNTNDITKNITTKQLS